MDPTRVHPGCPQLKLRLMRAFEPFVNFMREKMDPNRGEKRSTGLELGDVLRDVVDEVVAEVERLQLR